MLIAIQTGLMSGGPYTRTPGEVQTQPGFSSPMAALDDGFHLMLAGLRQLKFLRIAAPEYEERGSGR